MKKTVYIIGIVCLSIILFGTIFKLMHFPGAAILLIIGLMSLTLVFLPISYYKLLKSTNDKLLKLVFHTAFFAFFVSFVGMLFKILNWPGAGWFLIVGLPLPFVLFLPAYIVYHNKRKLKTDLHFFSIILFMIYLAVFSSLLALSTSYNVINAYAHSTQSIADANKFLASQTKFTASKNSEQLINEIEKIKQSLITSVNSDNVDALEPDGSINYHMIYDKNKKMPIQFFNDAGFIQFNKQFDKYKTKILKSNSNNLISRLIKDIDIYRVTKEDEANPIITKLSLISALNVLTDWQNKILLISYNLK